MSSCLSTSPCASCPDRDEFLCPCLQVTESTVMAALESLQIRSLADLRRHTGAGDGCTACHRQLIKYIELYAAQSFSSSEPICSVK